MAESAQPSHLFGRGYGVAAGKHWGFIGNYGALARRGLRAQVSMVVGCTDAGSPARPALDRWRAVGRVDYCGATFLCAPLDSQRRPLVRTVVVAK